MEPNCTKKLHMKVQEFRKGDGEKMAHIVASHMNHRPDFALL